MDYIEMEHQVIQFLKESKIGAYDLARIAENLCTCRTCKFYVQHYTKAGEPIDFGHCNKNSIPKGRRPNARSCGFWTRERNRNDE